MPPFSVPKSIEILPKIDPKMHQFFDRILPRFLFPFGLQLGTQVGAMLATFSHKMVRPNLVPPSFLLRWLFFQIFSRGTLGTPSDRGPKSDGVPLLGLVFGPMWARFSKVLWSILQVLRLFFWLPSWRCLAALFNVSLLAVDGLVGLREAQRNL